MGTRLDGMVALRPVATAGRLEVMRPLAGGLLHTDVCGAARCCYSPVLAFRSPLRLLCDILMGGLTCILAASL